MVSRGSKGTTFRKPANRVLLLEILPFKGTYASEYHYGMLEREWGARKIGDRPCADETELAAVTQLLFWGFM